ncbi:MAG: DoxX family protein [Ectothiorhodospiraceae bacterium]|nr:DoxX family protein [Ectothiorhodospiraceae bacterium]
MKFLWNDEDVKRFDMGMLFLRVAIGVMMFFHGLPKMRGGPERWEKLGGAMTHLGIDFMPAMWGFMAAFAETGAALLVVAGLFYRPALLLLISTMIVATAMHLGKGDGFVGYSRPIEMGIVFIAMFILGAGKHSLDARIFSPKK